MATHMSKTPLLIGALLVGGLLVPVSFWLAPFVLPAGRISEGRAPWLWDEQKANLKACIDRHLTDYDVVFTGADSFYGELTIRSKKDGSVIYYLKNAHKRVVLTRWKDTLFVAEYSPIATGCEVIAVDLGTGKRVWKTRLRGIGPTGHSQYSNSVNIETDGAKVIVYGNESHGKYVEHVDMKTGKTLLNRAFDVSEWE